MEKQAKRYTHLSVEARATIAVLHKQGCSARSIAREIGRSPSTVSRELRRNSYKPGSYEAQSASARHRVRRWGAKRQRKLHGQGLLWQLVTTMLSWLWSPQQIQAELKRQHPGNPAMNVSHETIYTAIYAYPKGELRKGLIDCLRQGKSTRKPRSRGQDRRGQLPDMLSIHLRPPEVEDRVMPGHWEGDLIKGEGNKSAVGVLVERTTRLVLLARMADSSAQSALEAFSAKLQSIAQPLRKTLTYDQGKEMSRHTELALITGVKVYFCDPHSPWQRGSCENTNGLLRQYMPKGTDLSVFTQDELDGIADRLNGRPRQTLGWDNPLQVYERVLKAESLRLADLQTTAGVALQT